MQGPRLLHLLLVTHAACEHGELIELAPGTERVAPADDRPGTGPDRAEKAHGDAAGHDHCDAPALRHLPVEVGPALGAPTLLTSAPCAAAGPHEERRPLPLLALAPKGSPPAA